MFGGQRPKPPKVKAPGVSAGTLALFIGMALAAAGISTLVVGTRSNNVRSTDYDYVVVGGGAAGAVMAERLSRSGRYSVLLIEAGPDEREEDALNIIAYWTRAIPSIFMGKYFWQHVQERQNFNLPLNTINGEYARGVPPPTVDVLPQVSNNDWLYTSGRVLGGNSKVNSAQFVRGTDWTFDQWEAITGDPLWSTVNVLQAYKDLEKYYSMSFNPLRRGFSGDLTVTDQSADPSLMAQKLVAAFQQLTNLTQLDDYNDMFTASRLGPFLGWQMNVDSNQSRTSADRAFLDNSVRQRRNLDISTSSTATRVLFDSKKHAQGVLYLHNGHEFVAHAKRRVVLTAGTNTPTILQHSGVGDIDVLANAGIPLVQNNSNVGSNLRNHLKVTATFEKNTGDFPSEEPATVFEGGAFLPDPMNNPFIVVSPRQFEATAVNAFDEMYLTLVNLQPIATGTSYVADKDPLRVSLVDQIGDDDDGDYDVNMLASGVHEYACKLHEEFQGYGHGPAIDDSYRLIDPPLEICNNSNALQDWVRVNMDPRVFQWTSSCRMGQFNDGDSVTNSRGSVWGVTGLTIADRSLIPIPHDGDTSSVSYVIAKIIAEQILIENF